MFADQEQLLWIIIILIVCAVKGVMRLRSPLYGGSWVPVFEASKGCSESQTCWPVGVSASEIYCIISPASTSGPQVRARVSNPISLVLSITFGISIGNVFWGNH